MAQYKFLYLLLFIGFSTFSATVDAKSLPVQSPFYLETAKKYHGLSGDQSEVSCPQAPDPVRNLEFYPFYKDKHRSKISKKDYEVYKKSYQPISYYETELIKMANHYVQSLPSMPGYALCAATWLHDWAKSDALLGQVTYSGQYIRKWILASVASAYVQIKDEPDLDPRQKQDIERWLSSVGQAVIQDYSEKTERRSRRNNHLYWAAWAVAITSVAVQDRDFFDWAMTQARFGIDQIEKDGVLPLELYRQSRALHYHLFALTPLVFLAEIAMVNDIDLYKYHGGRLHKLVNLSLNGIEDSSYLEQKSGFKQVLKESNLENHLVWVEIYHVRFPTKRDGDIGYWQKKYRPFILPRAGGNLTLLYSIPRPVDSPEN